MALLTHSNKLRVWRRDRFNCLLNISDNCIRKLNTEIATVDHMEYKEYGVKVIGKDKDKCDKQGYLSLLNGLLSIGKGIHIKKDSLKVVPLNEKSEEGFQYTILVKVDERPRNTSN